jgi:hypothetical protein
MQIESVVPSVPTNFSPPLPAAVAHVTAHGQSQTAIVEQTGSVYEAYVLPPTGPAVTGPSVALAESNLDTPSTVNFQV